MFLLDDVCTPSWKIDHNGKICVSTLKDPQKGCLGGICVDAQKNVPSAKAETLRSAFLSTRPFLGLQEQRLWLANEPCKLFPFCPYEKYFHNENCWYLLCRENESKLWRKVRLSSVLRDTLQAAPAILPSFGYVNTFFSLYQTFPSEYNYGTISST